MQNADDINERDETEGAWIDKNGRGDPLLANGGGHRYGDGAVLIGTVVIRSMDGQATTNLECLQNYCLEIALRAVRTARDLVIGILVRSTRRVDVFGWDMAAAEILPTVQMTAGGLRRSYRLCCEAVWRHLFPYLRRSEA